jgi:hypothetical protein
MEENARTLSVMLEALTEVGASHAVFGGLLTGYYGKERATADVDMLVSRKSFEPLKAALPQRGYQVRQFQYVLKMSRPGEPKPVGDFVVVETNAVLQAAFEGRTPAKILELPVNIVQRGAFVALKFEAAVQSRRLSRAALDVHDIRGVVEREFGPLDEQAAAALAGKMYHGAVADLAWLIDDLRHGRWPRVVTRAHLRAALLQRQGFSVLRRRGR